MFSNLLKVKVYRTVHMLRPLLKDTSFNNFIVVFINKQITGQRFAVSHFLTFSFA